MLAVVAREREDEEKHKKTEIPDGRRRRELQVVGYGGCLWAATVFFRDDRTDWGKHALALGGEPTGRQLSAGVTVHW